MALAQNGWTASPDKGEIGVDSKFEVAGVRFPGGVRSGDVATVLRYVATQFHARVEKLRDGECWGYAYRDVRGGRSLSNHAAACAIDVNAPRHALGKSGTFTDGQEAEIREILSEVDGVVRWGGSFSRPDEMHFEIVGSPSAVKLVAAKLNQHAVPGPDVRKDDPVAHIPLHVTPDRAFRAAFMAEAGTSSAVVDSAWVTLGSTWGNTTVTVTGLDGKGKVMFHRPDVVVRNNLKVTVDVPSGCAIITLDGVVQHPTTIPACALVCKARAQ